MGYNSNFSLTGNLTRDPHLAATKNGKSVVFFTVAVNEGRGDETRTSFHDLAAYGTLAENIEATLRKGMMVDVIGDLVNKTVKIDAGGETFERQVTYLRALKVGPSLTFATAQVTKNQKRLSNIGEFDEEEDEAPKSRTRARKQPEPEEEYEAPKSRTRARKQPEPEEEDEAPKSRTRARKQPEPVDDFDDEDF